MVSNSIKLIWYEISAYMLDLEIELKRITDSKMISSNFSSLDQAYMHQNSIYFLTNLWNFLSNN